MWSAAIIAGGEARRFGGRDKSRLAFGLSTILDRQVALLREIAEEVLLVTSPARSTQFGTVDLPIVVDALPDRGPLGGIYSAVSAARHERVLAVACDMPFLTASFLHHLAAAGSTVDVAVPRTREGYQPLCATYARSCAAPLWARLEAGSLKAVDFIRDAEHLTIRALEPEEIDPFDPDGLLFFNVNTIDDYRRAIELADRRRTDPSALSTGRNV